MSRLPSPDDDPDDLRARAEALAGFGEHLGRTLDGWRPHPPQAAWSGISSDAQRARLDSVIIDSRSLIDPLIEAAGLLMELASRLDDARLDLSRLQMRLDDATESAHACQAQLEWSLAEADAMEHRATIDPTWTSAAVSARSQADAIRHVASRASTDLAEFEAHANTRAQQIVDEWHATDLAIAIRIDAITTLAIRGNTVEFALTPSSIVSAAFEQVPTETQDDLVRAAPEAIATLSGAPAPMRYLANRTLVESHVEQLLAARAPLLAVPPGRRLHSQQVALESIERQLGIHVPFLDPRRRLLMWDPVGDGRAVEVLGDLASAGHIAVVVPGITNTIANFDDRHLARSQNIWGAAKALDPETAVIAWLGYDTPGFVDALSKSTADDAHGDLAAFVSDLPVERHVTVVAHSYGTVLSAEAALRGMPVDDLILVGSPGTSLPSASDANLGPDARIWAMVTGSDFVGRASVGSLACPAVLLGIRSAGPLERLVPACRTDRDGDVLRLSHGVNPAHSDFGATELPTDGASGHSGYFDEGTASLEAIAEIVTDTSPPAP